MGETQPSERAQQNQQHSAKDPTADVLVGERAMPDLIET